MSRIGATEAFSSMNKNKRNKCKETAKLLGRVKDGGMYGKKNPVVQIDYDSATKRNKALTPATMWMSLGKIILSERSHAHTKNHVLYDYICMKYAE